MLTTVAYQLEGKDRVFALEGSVAMAGALLQWLRDDLKLVSSSQEVDALAAQVPDSSDCYIVPAFSGLFAPYWRPDARGVIVGLTRYVKREHIARAALEATAFQVKELVNVFLASTKIPILELRVDGGMSNSELLMQFQSDLLNVPVVRPKINETTALGVALAAGLGAGIYSDISEVKSIWQENKRWQSNMTEEIRTKKLARWKQAVEKSFNWV